MSIKTSTALGIQFLVVFTAVEDTRQNYREQLFDAFPGASFGDQLRLEFFEEANHTFMFELERVRLTQVIFDWLSRTNFTIRRGQRLPLAAQAAKYSVDHVKLDLLMITSLLGII